MHQQSLLLASPLGGPLSTDQAIGQRIVSSLNFDSRPVRQESVPQAHNQTFQWAFDSHLSDWLRAGDGTFWIAGKPGSGKSTFMKFIVNQPQTRQLLATWAGPTAMLAIASHFFWINGTPIQKSWQGLLQSLLFDVCRQHAALVLPIISPTRWAAAQRGEWPLATEPWSLTELTNGFRRLAGAHATPVRLCFFVDGLDEYDSDHGELCRVLRDMARSPHIKLCVSSRPWDVFVHHFGDEADRRLDIHALTSRDIQNFVASQLRAHPRWKGAAQDGNRDEETQLIQRVAAQADGVFIWAFFVTRSLSNCLSDGDRVGDLQTRLSELPADLEALFKHTLEKVRGDARAQMAGILQTAAHASEPLHVDIYWHVERELVQPGHALDCRLEAASPEDIKARREETVPSVAEKTNDLLKLVDNRFEFLHRTVRDFVLSKDMAETLHRDLPEGHDAFRLIATAYLGFLKTTKMDHYLVAGIMRVGPGQNSGPFISHLNRALVYAAEAAKSGKSNQQISPLLENYGQSVEKMIRTGHVTVRGPRDCDARLPFREELLRHDLVPFVSSRLEQDPAFFQLLDESPLFPALTAMSLSSGESPAPVPGILGLILDRGHSPNAAPRSTRPSADGASPWVAFSRSVMAVFNILSGPCMFPATRWNETLDKGIFGLLLSHGADPNALLLPGRPGSHTVFSHFLEIALSKFLGTECFKGYLEALDAFLEAGASLGVPKAPPGGEEAFGNLARNQPGQTILASFCGELESLTVPLTGDPQRAEFVASVAQRLVPCCAGQHESLSLLRGAVSAGLVGPAAQGVLSLMCMLDKGREDAATRTGMKRHRIGDGGKTRGREKHVKFAP